MKKLKITKKEFIHKLKKLALFYKLSTIEDKKLRDYYEKFINEWSHRDIIKENIKNKKNEKNKTIKK